MSNRLLHTKVSKRKPLTYFPKKEDGHNGDMQIVSIKGKGTYLCIKDKSEWKISEKFNPRNKFDTHIFDEIETRKIRGKGGLSLSLQSESVATTTYSGKTATTTTTTQPIIKVGDGVNKAVLSSLKNTPLVLQSGVSSSSSIAIYGNKNIVTTLDSTSDYTFAFDSNDDVAGNVRVLNTNVTSDGGNSCLNVEVADANADPLVRYMYRHDTPSSNAQWCHGMDGSDSNKFKINYNVASALLTPSTSSGANLKQVLSLTSDGDMTLLKDLYVTGNATVDGGDLYVDKASGDTKIQLQIGGSTKYTIGLDDSDSDLFKINSGSTIADPSDFEMDSSGNVVVTGTLTSSAGVCGGPKVTNHVTNDADDTMAGTLTIDKNTTATSTSTVKGVFIDYDHTGISASGQTITGIGLDLDMNCESVTHVGTVNQTGIDVTLVAAADGTQVNTGIRTNVSGGDKNYDILLEHDSTNYCTLEVSANGATTIATFDSDGTAGNFTLDADGDIELNADGGNIEFKDASVGLASLAQGLIDLYYDASNKLRISVSSAGVASLVTTGGTAADADFLVDAGGDITLDSGTGIFIAKNAGTEFSAANSAYAGMILGYTRLEGDLSAQNSYEIQDSMTVEDSTHQITFKTPPSENVEIEATVLIDVLSTDTEIHVGLSDNSTYNSIGAQFEYDTVGIWFSDDEASDKTCVVKWVLEAGQLEAVGVSNTFYIGFSTAGATKTAYVKYGLRATHGLADHPFVIKATALPATIYDGS